MLWSQAVLHTRLLASSFRGFNRLITYCVYIYICVCGCVFYHFSKLAFNSCNFRW